MNNNRERRFFYGYVVVLIAAVVMLMANGTRACFGVFLLPVLTDFGWTRAMTSGAFSLVMFLGGLMGLVMGRLNDKSGPRLVVTISGSLLGLGYLLMSQINTIWQLYLFYGALVGIGMSGFWVPLLSTTARWFSRRSAIMTGVVLSGVGIGTMVMPPLANWLISTYSWRNSYTIMGISVLIIVISAAQFLRRDPNKMKVKPHERKNIKEKRLNLESSGFALQQAMKTRTFWMHAVITFCSGLAILSVSAHIVPHAIKLGISAANAATILTVIGGVGIPARIIMGSTGDRLGYKPTYIICFSLMAISLLCLLLANELWMIYMSVAVFSLGSAGTSTISSPMAAHLFGLRSHGAIYGVITLSYTIGAAVGPTLAGGIFDITNSYQLAWIVGGIFTVVGIIAASLLKRPRSLEATNN